MQFQYIDLQMQTDLDIKEGQKVVVGRLRPQPRPGAVPGDDGKGVVGRHAFGVKTGREAYRTSTSVTLSHVNIDEIRELIALANESGVAELEIQRGENRVRIRRGGFLLLASGVRRLAGSGSRGRPAIDAAPPTPVAEPAKPGKPAGPDPNLTLVKSPIVGTFYESASPDAPPFVRVGEHVQPGKVLCIIESMKLMNEIEAETFRHRRKQARAERPAGGVRGGSVCHPRGLKKS